MTQTNEYVNGHAVHPEDITDYQTFVSRFRSDRADEQHSTGKYYMIMSLLRRGCNSPYIDAIYRFGKPLRRVKVDVYGRVSENTIVGLCLTRSSRTGYKEKLALLSTSPVNEVMLTFQRNEFSTKLKQLFRKEFNVGKFKTYVIPDPEISIDIFQKGLKISSILGNRTRMQMLLPLLITPIKKSSYRLRINPKLMYENLSILLANQLIERLDEDKYALTRIGHRVLTEYLTFLQRVKDSFEPEEQEVINE